MVSKTKFRGKRFDNGEWVHGYAYSKHARSGPRWYILVVSSDEEEENKEFVVDFVTTSQFTKLKDKNDREAYWGDIARYTDDSGQWQVGVFTEYDDMPGGYLHAIGGDDEGNQDGDLNAYREFEIIGNKFDNPELFTK